MRQVLVEINNLLICEESIAAPAWLGGKLVSDSPLPFTVWNSGGYFVRAFLREDEARSFAMLDQASQPAKAFALDGGDELFLKGFVEESDGAADRSQKVDGSSCWIRTRAGALIEKVDDLASAAKALLAQKAHSAASITGPHPVATPRKP